MGTLRLPRLTKLVKGKVTHICNSAHSFLLFSQFMERPLWFPYSFVLLSPSLSPNLSWLPYRLTSVLQNAFCGLPIKMPPLPISHRRPGWGIPAAPVILKLGQQDGILPTCCVDILPHLYHRGGTSSSKGCASSLSDM